MAVGVGMDLAAEVGMGLAGAVGFMDLAEGVGIMDLAEAVGFMGLLPMVAGLTWVMDGVATRSALMAFRLTLPMDMELAATP